MSRHAFLTVTALLATAAGPPEDVVKRELANFQGTWQRVAYTADGTKTPDEQVMKFQLIVRADSTYAVRVQDQTTVEGTARIDPTGKPKTMDMTPTTGRSKGKLLLGIYELDGDDYRLCYAAAGKERPRLFSSEPGSGHVLVVYKRLKR
jgi:uncharacterized protein (TIGR03067 family)